MAMRAGQKPVSRAVRPAFLLAEFYADSILRQADSLAADIAGRSSVGARRQT